MSNLPGRLAAALLAAALIPILPVTRAAEFDEITSAIGEARLDLSRAVGVEGLEIDMGLASMHLESGFLFPAQPISDHSLEMAFDGKARFVIEPPDALESQQLQLFTDRERLEVEVSQAILFVGDESTVTSLLERGSAAKDAAASGERAETAFGEWIAGAERRGFGVEAATIASIYGDAPSKGFFAVWCRSEDLDDFYYVVNPSAIEQVTLGQFVPLELDDVERHQLEKDLRKQRRRGRYEQLRIADLGDWDTWISASLRNAEGEPKPGAAGFEAEHYTLHVEIEKKVEIRGRAAVDVRVESDRRRVVPLHLFGDLKVHAVRDGDGTELAFHRRGSDLLAILEREVNAGEKIRLEVEYSGVLLDELVSGIYRSRDTYGWYPHVGTIDRATYDVTLRWPKKHELLASGRVEEEGIDGSLRWARRSLEVPSFSFGFEYGAYDVHTAKVGHVDLTIAFSKMPSSWEKGAKQGVIEVLGDSLEFFERKFGAYPLDYLTVATVPRGFSQGYLSFVTLAHTLVALPQGMPRWIFLDELFDDAENESRDETIAHEISHQWWGNKVGWYSYRDQWLSEALADFSATTFMAQSANRGTVYLARHAVDWKIALNRSTKDGRTLESLGPVVLGHRLTSSLSSSAYPAIVYDKGSVVFAMLARRLQPEPFAEMLKVLADAVQNRAISTPTFVKAIERMSGLALEEFADQYIYGTGVPEIYYGYSVSPTEEGGWLIEGTATQLSGGRYEYALLRDEQGHWAVSRERVGSPDFSDRAIVVPFFVALQEPPQDDSEQIGTVTERGLGGTILLQGETTHFSIPVDKKPRLFWLDQRGEVLAEFYSESHRPKTVLKYRALELSGEEAERTFRRALAAPLYSEKAEAEVDYSRKQIERRTRIEDASILLHLTRLYLDQGREDEARVAFDEAASNLRGLDKHRFDRTRGLLQSRFDVRDGEFKSAYQWLSRNLRLDFPRKADDTAFDDARRKKFSTGRWMRADAYALLALTAYETDHEKVAVVALEEAEKRGADMSVLRSYVEAERIAAGR